MPRTFSGTPIFDIVLSSLSPDDLPDCSLNDFLARPRSGGSFNISFGLRSPRPLRSLLVELSTALAQQTYRSAERTRRRSEQGGF